MWVRGLKQKILIFVIRVIYVAPHVGAWIETLRLLGHQQRLNVAPHVGAWIETVLYMKTEKI